MGRPTIHLIYVRYPLWLSVVCQIRAALPPGDRVAFVASAVTMKAFAAFGATDDDVILHFDVAEYLAAGDFDRIYTYVQYNDAGARDYLKYMRPADEAARALVTLNFYPDGYTNKIYKRETIAEIFSTGPEKPGTLYLMEVRTHDHTKAPGVARVEVLPSSNMAGLMERPIIKAAAVEAIQALPPAADTLLLLLRPWGSSSHGQGQLEFAGGPEAFAAMIAQLIEAIRRDIGRDLTIIAHPDRRDPVFSDDVLRYLWETVDYQLAAPDWPEHLSFDPFMYHFDQFGSGRLHIACFDSTACLPLIVLGRCASHYFGAPADSVPDDIADSDGIAQIKIKLKFLADFVAALPEDTAARNRFDPLFFKVTHLVET